MDDALQTLLAKLFRAHPWHGVPTVAAAGLVNAYVEIVPTDTVKYELDKSSGHLRIDRPQRFSSLCPMPYGFLPQTYCAERVAQRCRERLGEAEPLQGDGDPLDVCLLTGAAFAHGGFLCRVLPIGGLRLIDHDQVDDKIIAVLEGDLGHGHLRDLAAVPPPVLQRLEHYFLSYKRKPGEDGSRVRIAERYDRAEAEEVIRRSQEDYRAHHGEPSERLAELRRLLRG